MASSPNGHLPDFLRLIIRSERLRLTPVSHDDAVHIAREYTPDIARYMIPQPVTSIDEVYAFINRSEQEMRAKNALTMTIMETHSNEFLGLCTLREYCDKPSILELGIWIKSSAHGYHYGREAIQTLVGWARINLKFHCLIYPVDKTNLPSRKIAESLHGEVVHRECVITDSGKVLDNVIYRIGPTKTQAFSWHSLDDVEAYKSKVKKQNR